MSGYLPLVTLIITNQNLLAPITPEQYDREGYQVWPSILPLPKHQTLSVMLENGPRPLLPNGP